MTKTMAAWIIAITIAVAVAVSMKLSAQDHEEHSCQSQEAVFTSFNPGGQVGPFSVRINSAGAITGYYTTGSYPNLASYGFMREPSGTITTFIAPGASTAAYPYGTVADAINPAGAITGYYGDANSVLHGFLRARDGTITTFDTPGAGTGPPSLLTGQLQGTTPASINPEGTITGSYTDANFANHGFLRAHDGTFTEFDAPGAGAGPPNPLTGQPQGTTPTSINAEGTITGSYTSLDFVTHGFVRDRKGAFTNFDAPGAGTGFFPGTFPSSINPRGAITGYYNDPNNVSHGFIRAPDGTMTPNIDAPDAGAVGTIPQSINPEGAIAGYYLDKNYVTHGFLREPCRNIAEFDAPEAGGTPGLGTRATSISPEGAIAGDYVAYDAIGQPVDRGFVRIPACNHRPSEDPEH